MAPFGDVAPALELCAVASTGAPLDVVRPLALDALRRLVDADGALWTDVDVVGDRPVVHVVRPGPVAASVRVRHRRHVATHPAVGVEGCAPTVHGGERGDGHHLCLALPAPIGHRVAVGLHRAVPFTADDAARLGEVLPVVACAVAAAPPPAGSGAGALTARETDVLRSVATGLSDKQAARALGVSPRTVGKHLEHIYAKLGVAGRTEAAVEVGLLRAGA